MPSVTMQHMPARCRTNDLHPPLPISREEMAAREWDACDAIIVTGDAYIDHPAFGAGLIGRLLEALGLRVGIIAAPDLNDPDAFRVLGAPRLFWGITAGNLDSQLARLTVMRKRRRDDPYLPPELAERRPPNASITYTARARQIARGVPVILGGLEASLRRFPYYDYWSDKIHRSILMDAKADLLVYGMAESALTEIVARLRHGEPLKNIPGTAELRSATPPILPAHKTTAEPLQRLPFKSADEPACDPRSIKLPDFDAVAAPTDAGRQAFAEMTAIIHRNAAAASPCTLTQLHGTRCLIVHPPSLPLTQSGMDAVYALPFTRRPHPSYGGARIPAFEMIRDSITTHRGCYGGCAFCALALHQG
ncbi:MAG: YgiQ family radical SAM protein, partial [bacterium]